MTQFKCSYIYCVITLVVWVHRASLAVTLCPRGWQQWMGSCYILLAGKFNWSMAFELCDRPGSHLVVPDSEEENDFIKEMLNSTTRLDKFHSKVWIGCNDLRQFGSWECFADQTKKPNFTNWANSEPTVTDTQRCIRLSTNAGYWANMQCSGQFHAMCELQIFKPVFCLPIVSDGRVKSPCLHGQEIESYPVTGVLQCGQACWAEPRCRSFNLWQQDGDEQICQLNNATRGAALDNISTDIMVTCYYFDL